MTNVIYCAHRDAQGKPHVLRHERVCGEEYVRPLQGAWSGRYGNQWGVGDLDVMSLAIDLLNDALEIEGGVRSAVWLDFEEQVIHKLPSSGWCITQESVWNWYLAGLTIKSLNESAEAVLKGGG